MLLYPDGYCARPVIQKMFNKHITVSEGFGLDLNLGVRLELEFG